MATYILFWNPAVSSYTMQRFLKDFDNGDCVGNWSFYEHDKVKYGDTFYMVRCGDGNTGIVMRGMITSRCYEGEDWSPKKRRPIFYADLENSVVINPEAASVMLTPDALTCKMPDFDWYGGPAGRRLTPQQAIKLDKIWFEYINSNPQLFSSNQAVIDGYNGLLLNKNAKKYYRKITGHKCEVCGYNYADYFDGKTIEHDNLEVGLHYLVSPHLKRLVFAICSNCYYADDDAIVDKLILVNSK